MGLKSGYPFFELIDPLIDRTERQFSNMFIASGAMVGFLVELF
jgi:hypothetical protein